MNQKISEWLDKYLPSQYRKFYTDPFTFKDNPILLREDRRDSRRKDRLLFITITLVTLSALICLLTWLFQKYYYHQPWVKSTYREFGGSHVTMMFLCTAGVHYWFVLHAVVRRTNTFFLEEYRRNSLLSLLCTQLPPFQLALQACAQPFRETMIIALTGLPIYLLLLASGGCGLIDLFGLYLLFTMTAFRPPRWTVPVFANVPVDNIQKRMNSGAAKTWGEFWFAFSFVLIPFGSTLLSVAFGRGWGSQSIGPIWYALPRSARDISDFFPITWVMVVARVLVTPIPYYHFILPPIVIILPLYLFARILGLWETSLNLRLGDSDISEALWDLPAYWRSRRLYGLLFPFLLLGYLWPIHIQTQHLSVFLYIQGGRLDQTIAGLWWFCGSLGVMICWARVREINVPLLSRDLIDVQVVGKQGLAWRLVYVFSPLLQVFSLVTLACLLGYTNPFPTLVLILIPKLILATGVGALFVSALPPGIWWYLGFLLLPLLSYLIGIGDAANYVASISPLSILLSLSEHTNRLLSYATNLPIAILPWHFCIIVPLIAGLTNPRLLSRFLIPTRRLFWGIPSNLTGMPLILSVESLATITEKIPAPPDTEGKSKSQIRKDEREYKKRLRTKTAIQPKAFVPKRDTPMGNALVRWIVDHSNNSVLIKEMRVALRGNLGADQWISLGISTLVIVGILSYNTEVSASILTYPTIQFLGRSPNHAPIILGGLGILMALIMAIYSLVVPAITCGAAFTREKQKSTLGFLLCTPSSTRQIYLGKFFGPLTITFIGLFCTFIATAVLYSFIIPMFGWQRVLTTYAWIVLMPIGLLLMSGSLALAASTIFQRETDASGFAIFVAVVIVIAEIWFLSLQNGSQTSYWPLILLTWTGLRMLVSFAVAAISYAFAAWKLNRMRFGNVPMEGVRELV